VDRQYTLVHQPARAGGVDGESTEQFESAMQDAVVVRSGGTPQGDPISRSSPTSICISRRTFGSKGNSSGGTAMQITRLSATKGATKLSRLIPPLFGNSIARS
jgi:hypothetical protein